MTEIVYFTLVLWIGPNGFRRYPMCDKCKDKTKKEQVQKEKKA
jgi:hypothetical protein